MKRFGITLVAAVAVLLVGSAPVLAGEPTEDESNCQEQTGGRIIPRFVLKKTLRLVKCEKGARSGANPSTDCDPPYGGDTAVKIGEAQDKAEQKIADKCPTTDPDGCPECYDAGGNCAAFAATNVTGIEGLLDGFKALIYCNDTASTDGLNGAEAQCQDDVAKALAKYVKKIAKCAAKCVDTDRDADGTTGTACVPATITDQALLYCRSTAATKAAAKIDGQCVDAADAPDFPECHVAMTGASWTALAGSATDGNYPTYYCQDP